MKKSILKKIWPFHPYRKPRNIVDKTQQLRLGFWHTVWHTPSLGKLWLELAINGKWNVVAIPKVVKTT